MTRQCITCGASFEGNGNSRYCPPCAHERKLERRRRYYDAERKNKTAATKTCVVCGKAFVCPPSRHDRLQTCSPECRSKHLGAVIAERPAEDHARLEHRRAAGIQASPKTGPYETHIHAKEWLLIAPDGTRHEIRNLKLWTREHAAEYGLDPQRMYDRLIAERGRWRRGEAGAPEWRGWRLWEAVRND